NPSRLTDTRASKSSVVNSVKGLVRKMPALFTKTLTVPKFLIAASTALAAVCCMPISPSSRTRLPEAVSFRLASREVATTLYPSSRNASTKPEPIPPEAPVMMAVFLSGINNLSFLKVRTQYRGYRPSQSGFIPLDAPRPLRVKNRQSLGPIPRSHQPPYLTRNDHHRQCGPQPWAHLAGKIPAPRSQTITRTCPKSPAGAAVFRASMLATWDRPRRWSDSRKTCRSESRSAWVDSETRTRQSIDQDRSARRSDRFLHGGCASRLAISDWRVTQSHL